MQFIRSIRAFYATQKNIEIGLLEMLLNWLHNLLLNEKNRRLLKVGKGT